MSAIVFLGMDKCLKQITDRYGAGCTFIILSNNPERIELAVKVIMSPLHHAVITYTFTE